MRMQVLKTHINLIDQIKLKVLDLRADEPI